MGFVSAKEQAEIEAAAARLAKLMNGRFPNLSERAHTDQVNGSRETASAQPQTEA